MLLFLHTLWAAHFSRVASFGASQFYEDKVSTDGLLGFSKSLVLILLSAEDPVYIVAVQWVQCLINKVIMSNHKIFTQFIRREIPWLDCPRGVCNSALWLSPNTLQTRSLWLSRGIWIKSCSIWAVLGLFLYSFCSTRKILPILSVDL